jgi:hypothetical protein
VEWYSTFSLTVRSVEQAGGEEAISSERMKKPVFQEVLVALI